jgi:thiol-disulfide isomerase/thioredoxin
VVGNWGLGCFGTSHFLVFCSLSPADHKYVLIDFGANWCPPCQTVDAVLHRPPVSERLERNFHVVAVDIGETKQQLGVLNIELRYQYGVTDTGIPVLVILSPDSALVATSMNGFFGDMRDYTDDRVNSFLITYGPKAGG